MDLYTRTNASYFHDPAESASFSQAWETGRGTVLVSTVILAFIVKLVSKSWGGKPPPPGVKRLPRLPGLPWAGRFWDVPSTGIESAWHFGRLHDRFGPIYEWKVMGSLHIWIQTDKIARDLLVSRQRNYGDRNELPAAVGVREGAEVLPLMGYGERFLRYKNFMHLIMRNANQREFYGWPADENKKTLRRLLDSPDRWSEHMLVHCARTIAAIAWGDPDHGRKLLKIVPSLLKAVSPGNTLVSKLTFLSNLPEIVSPWKKEERRRQQEMTDAFMDALKDAQQSVSQDGDGTSWSQIWLEKQKGAERLDFYEAAHAIGSSSFVGIATIGGPLHTFFLAMCHYPSWQRKVQEEIDRVCGDRPPVWEDMPRLPALRATVKELLRWRQSNPLGVPHQAIEDDVYEGYLIPKGAILHVNQYLVSRDESMYPHANEYRPERWLDPAYPTFKEPLTEFPSLRNDRTFGYGNRGCPGSDLTHHELTTLLGAVLWAFNVSRFEGRQGYENPLPWYETAPWVITMSKQFPCNIEVRSESRRRWILEYCPRTDDYIKSDEKDVKDRWDVVRGGDLFEWEGLASRAENAAKLYPVHV